MSTHHRFTFELIYYFLKSHINFFQININQVYKKVIDIILVWTNPHIKIKLFLPSTIFKLFFN